MLYFTSAPLFSQNAITMNAAIDDFARDFISHFPNKKIAVIAFETDRHNIAIEFIDTMIGKIYENSFARSGNTEVYERHRLEYIQRELDFSMSGRVSEETIKRIGQFIGVDTVIYGSLRKGASRNEYQMTITAADTETARILFQKSPYKVSLAQDSRLWVIGASIGSSFTTPLLIGTFHGTLSPFRFSFLEFGVEFGILSSDLAVTSYYSISPFAHCAFFIPFDKSGWYAGAGVGYLHSEQTKSGSDGRYRSINLNITTGFIIQNVLNISYTLRTNFTDTNNKLAVGYIYRF